MVTEKRSPARTGIRLAAIVFIMIAAALTLASVSMCAQTSDQDIPVPRGLMICKDDDPIVSLETRVAGWLGAKYLACFTSDEEVTLHGSSKAFTVPLEHAIAIGFIGGAFSPVDLDASLSKERQQWNVVDPVGEKRNDYQARVNLLLKDTNSHPAAIQSVKPMLVSIDRLDERVFVIVSIREYSITKDGDSVRSIKATAAAHVLQGTRLVRLEIVRELRTPSDIEDIRMEIAAWSRATSSRTAEESRP